MREWVIRVSRARHEARHPLRALRQAEPESVGQAQLVEQYIDHDRWFRALVQEGLDQLDRGQFVSHEEVGARIGKLFRP